MVFVFGRRPAMGRTVGWTFRPLLGGRALTSYIPDANE
jgi:hypothetical protein